MSDVDRAMEMTLEGQLAKMRTIEDEKTKMSDVDRAMEMTLEGQLAKMRTIEDEKTKIMEFKKLNEALRVIPETKKIKIIIELQSE